MNRHQNFPHDFAISDFAFSMRSLRRNRFGAGEVSSAQVLMD
jgi:hypothetical protein